MNLHIVLVPSRIFIIAPMKRNIAISLEEQTSPFNLQFDPVSIIFLYIHHAIPTEKKWYAVTIFHHIRGKIILKNIGEINGKALIFGGPYSNDEAVRKLRQKAQSMNLAPHQVICTGDTVAYCA